MSADLVHHRKQLKHAGHVRRIFLEPAYHEKVTGQKLVNIMIE